jgi:hypothetical protein
MTNLETNAAAPDDPNRLRVVGVGLAAAALALPVFSGTVNLFVTSEAVAVAIAVATVFSTGVLMAIDADRLGTIDLNGRERASGQLLCLGMFLLWIVFYPLAFFRRRHFGGPNLSILAILVAVYWFGSPFILSAIVHWRPPGCDSQDVVRLVEQVVRRDLLGTETHSIDGHREVAYDRDAKWRQGECVAHTKYGDFVVIYFVHWADSYRGRFEVEAALADVPPCMSPQVVRLLERVIRNQPELAKARFIDGHREIRYDSTTDRRHGQCVVHTADRDIVVDYIVQWQVRDKRVFQVEVLQWPTATETPAIYTARNNSDLGSFAAL